MKRKAGGVGEDGRAGKEPRTQTAASLPAAPPPPLSGPPPLPPPSRTQQIGAGWPDGDVPTHSLSCGVNAACTTADGGSADTDLDGLPPVALETAASLTPAARSSSNPLPTAGSASDRTHSADGNRSPSSRTAESGGPAAAASPRAATGAKASPPKPEEPSWRYDESARLAALFSYQMIGSPREAQFDDMVRLAAEICQTPAALITFLTESTQYLKSEVGFPGVESTPRSVAFCDHTIRTPQHLLVVPDATKDERFKEHPLVTGPPFIRFYAGAPLVDQESGQALGAVCVIDYVPRELNELQRLSLTLLGRQVMAACESRRRISILQSALQQLEDTRNELKQSKEEAEQALTLAEQANNAKSQFLANMSHEIRTPLNGVLGTASLLLNECSMGRPWDHEQKDMVRVIQSSGEHLLIVLNDILDYSKFESGKLEIDYGRVELQSMLEQAIELAFKAKPALELVYDIAQNVPPLVCGDITRLRQIVVNLLSNACKFTQEGQIIIHVEQMSEEDIQKLQQKHAAAAAAAASMEDTPMPSHSPPAAIIAPRFAVTPPSVASPLFKRTKPSAANPSNVRLDSPLSASRQGSDPGKNAAASATSSGELGPAVADGNNSSNTNSSGQEDSSSPGSVPTRVRATSSSEQMLLVFSVSDTGIGIEASKIHKLFSAFTQLDVSITARYGGTGLGLAISARLAQLMGGSMWVVSEEAKGSTFFFSIRTQPWPPQPPPHTSSSNSSPSHIGSQVASPLPLNLGFSPPSVPAPAPRSLGLGRSVSGNNIANSQAANAAAPGITLASVPSAEPDLGASLNSPRGVLLRREGSPLPRGSGERSEDSPLGVAQVTPDNLSAPQRLAHFFPALAAHSSHRNGVLVVERCAALLQSLVTQLTRWGFSCMPYSSVQAADEALGNEEALRRYKLAAIILAHEGPTPVAAASTSGATLAAASNLTSPMPMRDLYGFIDKMRKLDHADDMEDAGGVSPGAGSPPPFVIPAILLLPSKMASDEHIARTPPVTDASRCTRLRKPVLYSKLFTLLAKALHTAVVGSASGAPGTTQPPPSFHYPSPLPAHSALLKKEGACGAGGSGSGSSPRRHRSPLPQCVIGNFSLPSGMITDGSSVTHVYHRPAQPSSRARRMIGDPSHSAPALPHAAHSGQLPPFFVSNQAALPLAAPAASGSSSLPLRSASPTLVPRATLPAASPRSASPTTPQLPAAGPAESPDADHPLDGVGSDGDGLGSPLPQGMGARAAASGSPSVPKAPGSRPAPGLSVLVCEDNSVNMKLAVRMLATLGYTKIAQCWNGAEAVDYICTQGHHADIILLDKIMPVMCGPPACELILKHYATNLPDKRPPVIIALTASCMESDREEAARSGHSDFLAKPISLPILKQKMSFWSKHIRSGKSTQPPSPGEAAFLGSAPLPTSSPTADQ